MGSSQSTAHQDEKVFTAEVPIEFSQDVLNRLSDHTASPETTPQRQTTLDSHVRARIEAELEHLRAEEEKVRKEIEDALEKENIDKERSMAGQEEEGDALHGGVKNSAVLIGDLEEIRKKVEKYQDRRDLRDFPAVKTTADAVVSCYKSNPDTPLDCWGEVAAFKASVTEFEQKFIHTLPS